MRVLHGVQVISKLIFNALPSYIHKLATNLHAFASCVQQRLAATVGAEQRTRTPAAIGSQSVFKTVPAPRGFILQIKKRPAVAERFVLWPLGLEADGPSPIVRGGFQTDTRAGILKISKFYFFREPIPFWNEISHRGDALFFLQSRKRHQ